MYSAFDGVHTYQLVAHVPRAQVSSTGPDHIDASTLQWTVDDDFVTLEPYAGAPDAVLLTTKKPGMTFVRVSGSAADGQTFEDEARLSISQATDQQWRQGEMRYDGGSALDWVKLEQPGLATDGACVSAIKNMSSLPREANCADCHAAGNQLGVPVYTPEQTAGLSNDQLITIFTQGWRPMDASYSSPFLKNMAAADALCIYQSLHTWEISEDVKAGIVWVMRSLPPKPL